MSERETSATTGTDDTSDDDRTDDDRTEPLAPDTGPASGPSAQRAPLTAAEKRWLAVIVGVGAVLRLAWLAYAHAEPPTSFLPAGDQYSYWYYGTEIAQGRGYVSFLTHDATAYYPIGYPAILAGLFWLADHTPFVDPDLMLVAGAFHVVVSAATVALTFVVARRLLGARAGLIAAAVMALFPNMIAQVTTLQLETTFIFLTLAALAIIVDHDWSSGLPSRQRLLAFGAVLAVSALVRPFSAPLLLALALAVLAVGAGWRRALAVVAVPGIVVVAAFVPWTIRNAVEMDAFVPSSTNMGDTLCIDRGDDVDGGFRWSTHDGCVDPALPEVERNSGNTRKAVDWVIDNPERELVQIGRRARLMFESDHDGFLATEMMGSGPIYSDGARDLFTTAGDWYFRVVLVAAVAGLPLLWRSPRPERRLVVTVMAALLVIPLLLWGNARFHLPLTPFLAISAAALAAAAVDRIAPRAGPAAAPVPSTPSAPSAARGPDASPPAAGDEPRPGATVVADASH
jgi:hypothetical protein